MPVQQDQITVFGKRLQHGLPVGCMAQRIQVVQQAMVEHQVEGLLRMPCRDVGLYRLYRDAGLPGTRRGELKRLGNEVERRDLPAALRQINRIRAGTAADIKRPARLSLCTKLGQKQRGLVMRPGQIPPGLGPVVGCRKGFQFICGHAGWLPS
jgi:hypothetical protein